MLAKIAGFIAKDTSSQNESKKLIVVLRILMLSTFSYFVICTGVAGCFGNLHAVVILGFLMMAQACLFWLSYSLETVQVLSVFVNLSMAWIWILVHFMGWNVGVQHFIMLLLIFCFFSRYNQRRRKVLMAIFYCSYRILLYSLYRNEQPVWQFSVEAEIFLQVVNTVVIFWCLSVVGYIFSKDTQELESKLVEYNNQLALQAHTDTLTGLYNRRWTESKLAKIASHPKEDDIFSVCICDIDFFKKVNDNYGHDFGDVVLQNLAALFKEHMTNQGFAARWGGEEFLLVFTNCNGDDAFVKLEAIRRKVKDMVVNKNGQSIRITLTYGLAEYDFINGLDHTVKEADKKLYMGKERGRDIIIY